MTIWEAFADEMDTAIKKLKEVLPDFDVHSLSARVWELDMVYSRNIPSGAADIAEATKDGSLIERLLRLTEDYGSNYSVLVGNIFQNFGSVARSTKDTKLLEDLIVLFEDNKQDAWLLRVLTDSLSAFCLSFCIFPDKA